MKEILQSLNPEERQPIDEIKFLARLDGITEEDIQHLQDNVLPEYLDSFNEREDLELLTLIFKTPEDEIKDILRIEKRKKIMLGLHDEFKSKLNILKIITGNEKWVKLYFETKGESR